MANQNELQVSEIDNYTRLQKIKQANEGTQNDVLDYEIAISKAKLETMGVNLESITLVK